MSKLTGNRVINGTYGSVWLDGELLAEVESFEAKVTLQWEDVNFANDGAVHKKAMGWTGEGSMTLKHVYSRIQRKMADSIKRGIYPRFQIVGKVADPSAFGAERVVLNDVTVNEFNLLKFEQKTIGSQDISFAFSDYDMVEMI